MEQSVPISSNTFWGTPFLGPPFLKKGPLKLQRRPHLTLIGQFSRINPALCTTVLLRRNRKQRLCKGWEANTVNCGRSANGELAQAFRSFAVLFAC